MLSKGIADEAAETGIREEKGSVGSKAKSRSVLSYDALRGCKTVGSGSGTKLIRPLPMLMSLKTAYE